MDRRKTYTCFKFSCLAFLFTLNLWASETSFLLGKVTQAQGEITFLPYTPPYKVKAIGLHHRLLPEGSYLTQDNAFFTMQLFDGSWVRVSPNTKFAYEYDPQAKNLTMNLFTGSAKILFSTTRNKNKLQRFIVKSGDAVFETVEGKFSVVRNTLTNTSSIYVEKGTVTVTQGILPESKMEIVHSKETTALKDRNLGIPTPRMMTEKELKYLHSARYLKLKKSQI